MPTAEAGHGGVGEPCGDGHRESGRTQGEREKTGEEARALAAQEGAEGRVAGLRAR